MTDETGRESEQPDMDQQIIEAESRLEPLRIELISFEDNIKVEGRCKTCNLLWHEHKDMLGCGVKEKDVQPDVMLKSLMEEESRLDAILQVREENTGTKAAVRELTRNVENLGTEIDNGASYIVQLKKDKKDLQDKKKELEKQKQELEQRETHFSSRLHEKEGKITTLSNQAKQWSEANDNLQK
jgi:chromosome segregation ATPase